MLQGFCGKYFLVILMLHVQAALADYELLVTLHSFVNTDGRCADIRCFFCCDGGCPAVECDYYFAVCQRPAGTSVSYTRSVSYDRSITTSGDDCSIMFSNDEQENPNALHIFSDSVYGLPNPMTYLGEVWDNEGTQILLELIDLDGGRDDLIDRFVINVTQNVGTMLTQTYPGIFGFATLNVSLMLQCAENFYDANCNRSCIENCTCGPGLTGPFCTESIDDCINISCGENQRCEDDHLSFVCVCEPGFTGPGCGADIDECAGVDCNSGTCQEGRGYFTCICPLGYTGQFCEEQLDSYQVQIIINSISNPDGRCADESCISQNKCCDGSCPRSSCDYFFHYCLRTIDTPVSGKRSPFEGNCSAFNTLPESHNTDEAFRLSSSHSTFTLFGRDDLSRGLQVFMELIDSDRSSNSELIERFAINVTSLDEDQQFYEGIFGLARINVNISVICEPEFTGYCEVLSAVSSPPTLPITTEENSSKALGEETMEESSSTALAIGVAMSLLHFWIVVVIATVAIVCVCIKKRLKQRKFTDLQTNEAYHVDEHGLNQLSTTYGDSEFNSRNNGYSYPEIEGEFTSHIQTADSEYQFNSCPAYRASNKVSLEQYDNEYDYEIPYWVPADKRTELLSQFRKLKIPNASQENLNVKSLLGRGAFGEVYKGVWRHVVIGCEEPVEEEVAVKTMEDTSKEEDRIKFLQEAVIMGQFNHINIVKIKAILVLDDTCKIVMELMTKGDLKKHLPKQKSRFPNELELSSQLLYYSRQVASGMSYLSSKGYIHRDLAARNVLVSNNDICKVGDFGLSRDLQKEDYYKGQKGGKIPLKWTAPEALHYHKYSTASDVWSFGCVLYEIWSLGVDPYSNLNNAEAMKKITSDYFLPPPPGCPRAIYDVMIKCWNQDAASRPVSDEICTQLNIPEFRVLKWSDEDVAKYSKKARTVGAPLVEGQVLYNELQNPYIT